MQTLKKNSTMLKKSLVCHTSQFSLQKTCVSALTASTSTLPRGLAAGFKASLQTVQLMLHIALPAGDVGGDSQPAWCCRKAMAGVPLCPMGSAFKLGPWWSYSAWCLAAQVVLGHGPLIQSWTLSLTCSLDFPAWPWTLVITGLCLTLGPAPPGAAPFPGWGPALPPPWRMPAALWPAQATMSSSAVGPRPCWPFLSKYNMPAPRLSTVFALCTSLSPSSALGLDFLSDIWTPPPRPETKLGHLQFLPCHWSSSGMIGHPCPSAWPGPYIDTPAISTQACWPLRMDMYHPHHSKPGRCMDPGNGSMGTPSLAWDPSDLAQDPYPLGQGTSHPMCLTSGLCKVRGHFWASSEPTWPKRPT